ncbi:MAG TPA: nuclease, partial [Pseudomonas sp.]|nr:nuclease [Pseudomonas sp.]
ENGGRVGLRTGREARDKYGRTLAQVYGRSGDNLSARLLSEGLGFHVAVAPNVSLVTCQKQAERVARKAGRGVWRHSPVQGASALRSSGFALVGGKASHIQRNRSGIRIEIDNSLILQVPARLQRDFPASFTAGLIGRRVEVRGWVLDRSRKSPLKPGEKRWLLMLTDRSMLERVNR